jgi:hypothetical protein
VGVAINGVVDVGGAEKLLGGFAGTVGPWAVTSCILRRTASRAVMMAGESTPGGVTVDCAKGAVGGWAGGTAEAAVAAAAGATGAGGAGVAGAAGGGTGATGAGAAVAVAAGAGAAWAGGCAGGGCVVTSGVFSVLGGLAGWGGVTAGVVGWPCNSLSFCSKASRAFT